MTKEQEKIFNIYLQGQKSNIQAGDALAKEVQSLIDDAVAEAAKLGERLKSLSGFQFSKHPELQKRLDKLCQRLAARMTATIEQGSKEAWLRANTVNSEVIAALSAGNAQLAADMAAGQTKPQNNQALHAFQQRVVAGMNLADRVWNLTSRMNAQMQDAIEIAIAHGTPAQKLSQGVRQCLQNPDNFFRRFKYKVTDEPLFDEHGKPILDSTGKQATRPVYGRKWKMRYTDEDGKTRWKDVDLSDYRYGRGVYRSAYKNAMRLARTEINMAYHASDTERWSTTWWVKGIRISLSNNHTIKDSKGQLQPLVDICDDLAGDYPPDFSFTGWHPQCRCYATAITASMEEIREYHRRKRAGEDMSGYQVPGKITSPPNAFKRWVENNADRINQSVGRGAQLPYFLRENPKYITPAKGDTATEQLADLARRENNKRTAKVLAADPNYTDVEYDPKSGGMKATHIGHNFDPHTGHYERSVRDVAYKNGEKVILGNEPSDQYKQKSTEGTWNDRPMEIASAETATPKNIRNALKHCVSKPGAEVAVINLPNGADLADIEQGLNLFNGLRNAKGNQWRQFAEIVFISPDGIIKKLRP